MSTIDTDANFKRPVGDGMPDPQAEAFVDTIREDQLCGLDRLIPEAGIGDPQPANVEFKIDLTKWAIWLLLAQTALLVALMLE